MVCVVCWAYVFFGKVPDRWTVVGTVLIVAGGMIVLTVREAKAWRSPNKTEFSTTP